MKIQGQTITDAYQEWIKEEIKSTPKQIFEFGKFALGISIGTIGFITTIEKYTSENADNYYFISIFLLVVSLILSISIVLPKTIDIKDDSDLFIVFNQRVSKYKKLIWIWFVIWLIAICFGLYGCFVKY